uniref:Proheparin-binding EGF-like growth factor n=1 Tax=Varanus komodoensis TaxID=61221 RepID=A0A8D2Q4D8_VARKO
APAGLPRRSNALLLGAALGVLVSGDGAHPEEGRDDPAGALLLPGREALESGAGRDGAAPAPGDEPRDLSRVAFLSRPQDPVTPKNEGKRKKRRKGKGRKRDPCLRKYKDFCIHGECMYIKELKRPACRCHQGYYGERCHAFSLPVETRPHSYDPTTVLAATALVLSSLCLIIIVVLLMLRCHRQGGYDVENEEKVKLGITVNH